MGKDIKIRNTTYLGAEEVNIPLAEGTGTAKFIEPSSSTLTSGSQMLAGVSSFNADGVLVPGTIPSKSASDLTASGATVTVPAGNYATQATKSVATGSATAPNSISGTSASISTGTNTITLTKSVSVTPEVTPGYVADGTAGNSSVSLTASVTTKAAATITPTTTDQTIAADTLLTGTQTIKGDSNLVASKIVAPYSIFGVEGSAQLPVISYDDTNKVLSIS